MLNSYLVKIIITGFEPFGDVDQNPSQTLIEEIKKEPFTSLFKDMGFDVEAHVLPVEYGKAFTALKKLVDEHKPKAVFSFGVATNRDQICLERVALNYKSLKHKDNSGDAPNTTEVIVRGPDGVFSTIKDLDLISESLEKEGWRVKVSSSAGEYVCNALMYESILYAREHNFLYDFIHIPCIDLYNSLNSKSEKSLAYFVVDLLQKLVD